MAAERRPASTGAEPAADPDPAGTEPAGSTPAAAFFDLDKTLIQGSSAFQFGRAAYQAGLIGRRQLLADALANVRFRLNGATDEDSLALRDRIAASLEGTRVVDLERLGADVLAGILPRALSADAEHRPRASGCGPAGVHRHRRLPGAGRHPGPGDGPRRSDRIRISRGRRRRLHRQARPGCSSTARRRPRRCGAGRPGGDRPVGLLRLFGLRIRPADARAPSATPWPSTPTRPWPASPATRVGRCCISTGSGAGCGPRPRSGSPPARRRRGAGVLTRLRDRRSRSRLRARRSHRPAAVADRTRRCGDGVASGLRLPPCSNPPSRSPPPPAARAHRRAGRRLLRRPGVDQDRLHQGQLLQRQDADHRQGEQR